MAGRQNLSSPRAPLKVSFSEGKCSPVFIIPVMGYGAEPHDYPPPLTLNLAGAAPRFLPNGQGANMGAMPPYPHIKYHKNTQMIRSNTRLTGRQKMPEPHAALKVSLSVSTCSHRTCLPCLRSCGGQYPNDGAQEPFFLHAPLYPIGRTQEPFFPARAAESQFFREQMLSRFLHASDTPPEVHLPESACSPIPCPPGKLIFQQFHSL